MEMFHLISEADLGFTEARLWSARIRDTQTTKTETENSRPFTKSKSRLEKSNKRQSTQQASSVLPCSLALGARGTKTGGMSRLRSWAYFKVVQIRKHSPSN